jgi:uncharacterized protein (TIGR02145 family)
MQQKNPANPLIGLITVLTMALAFSCSSDNGDDPPPEQLPGTTACNDPATQTCCGNMAYDANDYFCYNGSKLGAICGNRKEEADIYDPDIYECKPTINANGIYLKTKPSDGTNSYEAVLIGTQTWMAENSKKNVSGSKCYDNSESNCSKYGRLYKWADAENACPAGWHLPSRDEWIALDMFVDDGTDKVGGAFGREGGIHLKAKDGWENCGPGKELSCLDTHGFAALPGGVGTLADSFRNAGTYGGWWNSTWDDQVLEMFSTQNYVSQYDSAVMVSVRCVKD